MRGINIKIYIPRDYYSEIQNKSVFQYYSADQISADSHELSRKEALYGPLTALYYSYKEEKAEYVGFYPPDRFLAFTDKVLSQDERGDIQCDSIQSLESENHQFERDYVLSCIGTRSIILGSPICVKSVYEEYTSYAYKYKSHLDMAIDVISRKSPHMKISMKRYLQGTSFYPYHMFIMKRECFAEYTTWLFTILEELDKKLNIDQYGKDMKPVCWYLAEIMLGIYFVYKENVVATGVLQHYLVKGLVDQKILKPAFPDNNIPIVLTSSNQYAVYTSITLKSILNTISAATNYDVIIVYAELSCNMQKVMLDMAESISNVSLRFFHIEQYVRRNIPQAIGLLQKENKELYFRILTQSIFREYSKILWIDSDLIVKRDLGELYRVEIEDNLLGAAIDPGWYAVLHNSKREDFRQFVLEDLGLTSPFLYFNLGVTLYSIVSLNKTFKQEELILLALKKSYIFCDQDIFNMICKDMVFFLDMRWNVLADVSNERVDSIASLAPEPIREEYMKARSQPYIIHFAGEAKPWQYPSLDFASDFWTIARQTVLYESIIQTMVSRQLSSMLIQARKLAKHEANIVLKKHVQERNLLSDKET